MNHGWSYPKDVPERKANRWTCINCGAKIETPYAAYPSEEGCLGPKPVPADELQTAAERTSAAYEALRNLRDAIARRLTTLDAREDDLEEAIAALNSVGVAKVLIRRLQGEALIKQ